jgi:hypothetical protein
VSWRPLLAKLRRVVVVALMILVTAVAGLMMPFAAPIRVFFRRVKSTRAQTEQVVPQRRVSPIRLIVGGGREPSSP